MPMRRIFSEEEMSERANFTLFMQTYFSYSKRHTSTFKYPLSIEMLFHLYKRVNPDTILSAADLILYYNINGLVQQDDNIYVDIRAKHVTEIPEKIFRGIEAHLTLDALRSLDTTARSMISTDPSLNAFREFIRLFYKSSNKNDRVATSKIHSMYMAYCSLHELRPISSKAMALELKTNISPVQKGYAGGKSGVNFISGTLPPDENWQVSLEVGVGIFYKDSKAFDNLGKRLYLVDGVPDTGTALYIQNRVKGVAIKSEQSGKAPSSAEEASTIRFLDEYRGAIKAKEADVERTEEASRRSTYNDPDEPNDEEFEESEPSETTHPGTKSSRSIEQGGSPGGLDWLNAELVTEFDDAYQEEPITLKEVFAALEITYRISPNTFTEETMDSYLLSMGTEYKAIDLWDDFMYYLRKNKGGD